MAAGASRASAARPASNGLELGSRGACAAWQSRPAVFNARTWSTNWFAPLAAERYDEVEPREVRHDKRKRAWFKSWPPRAPVVVGVGWSCRGGCL